VTDAIEVLHYQTAGGRIPFREWLDTVTDPVAYAAIQIRQDRLARGLFGDCVPVGEGVWELRIDAGAGYRVYYARSGKVVVLFLCGGDKRSQKTDIKTAKAYWRDYEQRTPTRSRSR
jgi:putative addiction module killer protein